jgi:anti-sigma28 factor (negative regulator of flagellin synthesis)
MKVNGTQEINPRTTVQTPSRAGTPTSAGSSSLTDTVDSPQFAQQAMATQSASHQAKVDTIASQVKQGTYVWPTSQQIADRILDDAELTAQLQAMFRA